MIFGSDEEEHRFEQKYLNNYSGVLKSLEKGSNFTGAQVNKDF